MRMRARGFTLIELLVTIAVLAILLAVAVPSFTSFRQRTALGGAAEQLVSAWTNARFEALRRDRMLKVSIVNSAGQFCIGTTTTDDPGDATACDCLDAAAANYCDISVYPGNQADWQGVTVSGTPTLGGGTGVAVIDPKRGGLTQTADAGGVSLLAPDGGSDYRLNVYFDRRGRAVVCEPSDAPDKIPRYSDRRCVL